MTLLIWLTAIAAAAVVLVLVGYLVGTAMKLLLALRDVKALADALEHAADGTAPISPLIDAANVAVRRIADRADLVDRAVAPRKG